MTTYFSDILIRIHDFHSKKKFRKNQMCIFLSIDKKILSTNSLSNIAQMGCIMKRPNLKFQNFAYFHFPMRFAHLRFSRENKISIFKII